ncbi:hypothetical protein C8Q75DRAFT_735021 [Abortiporus biennis]|nr:hypothetical protein C8Q75DRAFT_735021 [Abortiporus biennis]
MILNPPLRFVSAIFALSFILLGTGAVPLARSNSHIADIGLPVSEHDAYHSHARYKRGHTPSHNEFFRPCHRENHGKRCPRSHSSLYPRTSKSKNPKNLRLNEGALQAPARKEPDVPTTAGKSATMHHLSPNPQGHLSNNPPDVPKTPSSGGSLFSANGFAEPGQSSSVSLESSMFGEVEPPSSSSSEFSLASSMFAPGPPTKQQSPTKQHSPDSPTNQHSPHQRDFSSTKTPPRPQTP